ncbi:MAG TPA: hypothetical protein V6C57_24140, partial [Coleofasciculaceae cyanobacterium]
TEKSWSCGFSCIAKSKKCSNPIEGMPKTYADYLATHAQKLAGTAPAAPKATKPEAVPAKTKAATTAIPESIKPKETIAPKPEAKAKTAIAPPEDIKPKATIDTKPKEAIAPPKPDIKPASNNSGIMPDAKYEQLYGNVNGVEGRPIGGGIRVTGTSSDGKPVKVEMYLPSKSSNAQFDGGDLGPINSVHTRYADALVPTAENVIGISKVSKVGVQKASDMATSVLDAARSQGKEGDVVLVTHDVILATGKTSPSNALYRSLTTMPPGTKGDYASLYMGKIKNGQVVPLDKEDFNKIELGMKARRMATEQLDAGVYNTTWADAAQARKFHKEEDEIADRLAPIQDQWVGRKPKAGVVPSEEEYRRKAAAWAKSQGFEEGGVNGFTAEQTKAHDIAHPVTHDMVGLGSKGIHESFGGVKQKNGSPSLIAEEAIVNMVEHFSRGDSLQNSITNGIRLARVLSRNTDTETDEGRKYFRSPEFKNKLVEAANRIYTNDNFSEYMRLVRKYNQISGTVRTAGNDFNDTVSGG